MRGIFSTVIFTLFYFITGWLFRLSFTTLEKATTFYVRTFILKGLLESFFLMFFASIFIFKTTIDDYGTQRNKHYKSQGVNHSKQSLTLFHKLRNTLESLYLEPLYLEISLCRTKYLVPRMRFQANFLSLSRTLSISNKYFGPLKVRDREILLYVFIETVTMRRKVISPENR